MLKHPKGANTVILINNTPQKKKMNYTYNIQGYKVQLRIQIEVETKPKQLKYQQKLHILVIVNF